MTRVKSLQWTQPMRAAPPPKRSYTREEDWCKHKARILELRRNNFKLSEIRSIMCRERGLQATKDQYKHHLRIWRDKRNLTKSQRGYIIREIRKRGGDIPVFRHMGEVLQQEKVINVWKKRRRHQVASGDLEPEEDPEGISVEMPEHLDSPTWNLTRESTTTDLWPWADLIDFRPNHLANMPWDLQNKPGQHCGANEILQQAYPEETFVESA